MDIIFNKIKIDFIFIAMMDGIFKDIFVLLC